MRGIKKRKLKMKNILLTTCLVGCFACGSNGTNLIEPNPISTTTTTVIQTEVEKPKLKEIKWYDFNENTKDIINQTGQCVLFYFGNSYSTFKNDCDKMEETFKDQEIVELVSSAFLPVRFPVEECLSNENCVDILIYDLQIKTFPSVILVFLGDESVSLIGDGYMNSTQFKTFLLNIKLNFDACVCFKSNLGS